MCGKAFWAEGTEHAKERRSPAVGETARPEPGREGRVGGWWGGVSCQVGESQSLRSRRSCTFWTKRKIQFESTVATISF